MCRLLSTLLRRPSTHQTKNTKPTEKRFVGAAIGGSITNGQGTQGLAPYALRLEAWMRHALNVTSRDVAINLGAGALCFPLLAALARKQSPFFFKAPRHPTHNKQTNKPLNKQKSAASRASTWPCATRCTRRAAPTSCLSSFL